MAIQRRKAVDLSMSARAVCERRKADPLDEMLQCLRGRIPVPKNVNLDILGPMLARYDLVTDEDGKQWLELPISDKLEGWNKIARFVYPVLKSSEIKESKDYTLRVTVKKFGEIEAQGNETVVDVTPVAVAAIQDKND